MCCVMVCFACYAFTCFDCWFFAALFLLGHVVYALLRVYYAHHVMMHCLRLDCMDTVYIVMQCTVPNTMQRNAMQCNSTEQYGMVQCCHVMKYIVMRKNELQCMAMDRKAM